MHRARKWLGPLLAAGLFGLALWAIHREAGRFLAPREIVEATRTIGPAHIGWALLLTIGSYAALTFYDSLALREIGVRLPFRRAALAAFVAYAFSHAVGFVAATAASVRYRLYSIWGLGAAEVARVLWLATLTFWLGLAALGGVVLVASPDAIPAAANVPWASTRLLGGILLTLAAYLTLVILRKGRPPLLLRGHEVPLPGPAMTAAQLFVSVVDWILAAGVLYVLLPGEPRGRFDVFIGVFLLAHLGGTASQVPGGIGVFESLVLVLLGGSHPTPQVIAALVLYRIVYYVVPSSPRPPCSARTRSPRSGQASHAPLVWWQDGFPRPRLLCSP